ncbi:MAG: hypothetical protein PVG12_10770 [Gammaproteobacteria bacterium]
MTNTDKTRQKLVDSMRKSKSRNMSGNRPAAGTSAPKTKKSRSRRATTKSAKSNARVAGKTASDQSTNRHTEGDPYQGGRRVWPD